MSDAPRRLPEVRTLYDILPKGTEGGKEFSRIVDLLIFHEARRSGNRTSLFNDSAGDYRGLDSFAGGVFRKEGPTGHQYKFYPSPLSAEHRANIEESLLHAAKNQEELKLKKWILVTPNDFIESATRKGGGDVTWFEGLPAKHSLKFELEHWGHKNLLGLFLQTPFLCLFYYPELVDSGQSRRKTIADVRDRYDNSLTALYRDIQFVGMSVYKQEASRGVAIQEIYIPLTIMPDGVDPADPSHLRTDPLRLLEPGGRHVVLGDPGSGKSTLLRFLALAGMSKPLQKRYQAKPDKRLPLLVVLRKYADELKSNPDLGLVDYIPQNVQADLSLKGADLSFLEYYLESGQTILLFDGLDELPGPHFKQIIRDRVRTFLLTYPGNTSIVTSRIVGYDEPFSFDRKEFQHARISPLRLPEIEQFVRGWYRVRIENKAERERNIEDLLRILRDEEHVAIRQLAENPLLLTIVSLVHRIDAVLPDERVVLYQKCTETLLNTWHTWKYREIEPKNRGKIERRNRARMEAIAHWMHCRSAEASQNARAVVSYEDLCRFLTKYITDSERPTDSDHDPQDDAADFLDFIKKRAGLLVEAGDRQYSFVHLTFEEYLTATRIITVNEAEGVQGIWDTIAPHRANPRWHEVIRLLIAGLRSPDSQNALLQHLLSAPERGGAEVAELVGGLLLDGIEAAEARADEISERVLRAAINSETARTAVGI
jgi:hypothetical protein